MTESIDQDRPGAQAPEPTESIGNQRLPMTPTGPVGIGGWLLVFILWAGLNVAMDIAGVAIAAGQGDFVTGGIGGTIGLLLLVDIVLIVTRRKLGKTWALVTCGLIVAIDLLATIGFITGYAKVDLRTAIQTARDCALSVVWFLYFQSSQRVANTLID